MLKIVLENPLHHADFYFFLNKFPEKMFKHQIRRWRGSFDGLGYRLSLTIFLSQLGQFKVFQDAF